MAVILRDRVRRGREIGGKVRASAGNTTTAQAHHFSLEKGLCRTISAYQPSLMHHRMRTVGPRGTVRRSKSLPASVTAVAPPQTVRSAPRTIPALLGPLP